MAAVNAPAVRLQVPGSGAAAVRRGFPEIMQHMDAVGDGASAAPAGLLPCDGCAQVSCIGDALPLRNVGSAHPSRIIEAQAGAVLSDDDIVGAKPPRVWPRRRA